jgi:hypothetical protein
LTLADLVHNLDGHLAASDLAVVEVGLTAAWT